MEEKKPQTLTVEQQKRLNMTGVAAVDGFTDQAIYVTLQSGRMVISGEGLKVLAFSKTSGNLSVDGIINTIKFTTKKPPLLKRLLK